MSISRPDPVHMLFAHSFKQNTNDLDDDGEDDDDDEDDLFKGRLMQGEFKAQDLRSQERHLT